MMKTKNFLAALAVATIGVASTAHAGILAPDGSYKSLADSPFASAGGSGSFWVEDFEDGLLNSLGVTASTGNVKTPRSTTDSVDGDDGSIDGWGQDGHSFVVSDAAGGAVTFTFSSAALGQLPTFAGLVWTDGNLDGTLTFEAFDAGNNLIDSITVSLNHGPNGSTDEDRFLGVEFEGGISSIVMTASVGGFELDHLQYGFSVIPLPAPMLMGLAGLALVGVRRGRSRTA